VTPMSVDHGAYPGNRCIGVPHHLFIGSAANGVLLTAAAGCQANPRVASSTTLPKAGKIPIPLSSESVLPMIV